MLNKLPKFMTLLSFVSLASLGLWSCEQEPVVVDVTDIDISMTSATLVKGETVRLTAVVVPSNATETAIEWVAVDQTIVTVDDNGLVTALEVGETIVMAKSGEIVNECRITIVPIPAEGITLDKDELDLNVGETAKLSATLLPDSAENMIIEWSSSNTKSVTVDASGTIMAIASGMSIITAAVGEYKAECQVYAIGEPQIGDYYYSDGRWFTTPIEGKTPIGIIFYLGNPGKDDEALRTDHPECTHGLVVSLFFEKSGYWQSNAKTFKGLVGDWAKEDAEASKYINVNQTSNGDHLNKIVGYNNTKVYELFNADESNKEWPIEAMEVLQECRDEFPLPNYTSGWYIPSAKEVSLMCTGDFEGNIGAMNENSAMQGQWNEMAALLNEKVYRIPGAFMLSPNYYISSTEGPIVRSMYGDTWYTQWFVKMAYGYVFNQDKTGDTHNIRPVFAF